MQSANDSKAPRTGLILTSFGIFNLIVVAIIAAFSYQTLQSNELQSHELNVLRQRLSSMESSNSQTAFTQATTDEKVINNGGTRRRLAVNPNYFSSPKGKFVGVMQKKTWDAAEAFCVSEFGTHLASVSETSDQFEIVDTMRLMSPTTLITAWIGGRRVPNGGLHDFAWSDATTWALSFWPSSQPDNSPDGQGRPEDCTSVIGSWNYFWNDEQCFYGYNFICHMPTTIEGHGHFTDYIVSVETALSNRIDTLTATVANNKLSAHNELDDVNRQLVSLIGSSGQSNLALVYDKLNILHNLIGLPLLAERDSTTYFVGDAGKYIGVRYASSGHRLDFDMANQFCQSEFGTQLAIITSDTDLTDAKALRTRMNSNAWIGARQTAAGSTTANWAWIDGSTWDSVWAPWTNSFPRLTGQDCAYLSHNGFRDNVCTNVDHFMCGSPSVQYQLNQLHSFMKRETIREVYTAPLYTYEVTFQIWNWTPNRQIWVRFNSASGAPSVMKLFQRESRQYGFHKNSFLVNIPLSDLSFIEFVCPNGNYNMMEFSVEGEKYTYAKHDTRRFDFSNGVKFLGPHHATAPTGTDVVPDAGIALDFNIHICDKTWSETNHVLTFTFNFGDNIEYKQDATNFKPINTIYNVHFETYRQMPALSSWSIYIPGGDSICMDSILVNDSNSLLVNYTTSLNGGIWLSKPCNGGNCVDTLMEFEGTEHFGKFAVAQSNDATVSNADRINLFARKQVAVVERQLGYTQTMANKYDAANYIYGENGKYILVFNPVGGLRLTWQQASQYCMSEFGTNMAIINSDEDMEFAKALFLLSGQALWDRIMIGAKETNRVWHWVDGTNFTKTHWANGYPSDVNHTEDHCLTLAWYGWNDDPCHATRNFICHTPPISQQINRLQNLVSPSRNKFKYTIEVKTCTNNIMTERPLWMEFESMNGAIEHHLYSRHMLKDTLYSTDVVSDIENTQLKSVKFSVRWDDICLVTVKIKTLNGNQPASYNYGPGWWHVHGAQQWYFNGPYHTGTLNQSKVVEPNPGFDLTFAGRACDKGNGGTWHHLLSKIKFETAEFNVKFTTANLNRGDTFSYRLQGPEDYGLPQYFTMKLSGVDDVMCLDELSVTDGVSGSIMDLTSVVMFGWWLSGPPCTTAYQPCENQYTIAMSGVSSSVGGGGGGGLSIEEKATFTKMRIAVTDLSRLQAIQQTQFEERLRSEGQSGLTSVRGKHGNDAKSFQDGAFGGYAVASMHNHADHLHLIGIGEIRAVLNGVEFQTRHNDYKLRSPHRNTTTYHQTELIEFPPVPPAILNKATVAEGIAEMREYFRAWKDQNVTHRDYKPYFWPVLCYLEGTWIIDEGTLTEPFESERHFIDAKTWDELHNKLRFFANTGRKHSAENIAWLPSSIRNLRDNGTWPEFSNWEYRILCHKLGPENNIPFNRFRVAQDLQRQLWARPKTRSELFWNRGTRFEFNSAKTGAGGTYECDWNKSPGWLESIGEWNCLDHLMEQIPGKDNYAGWQVDSLAGGVDPAVKYDGTQYNAAYYNRYYRVTGLDAMGVASHRRGWHDQFLWTAQTGQAKVSPIGYSDKGLSHSAKVSYAIPLEIIYMTPLVKWNPYNITEMPNKADVTANGRTGRCDGNPDSAYDGYNPLGMAFFTPDTFFLNGGYQDPADTSGGAKCVLDSTGTIRKVRAAGHWIILPEIQGLGKIRQRYPIFPIHEQGNTAYKEVDAMKEFLFGTSGEFANYETDPNFQMFGDGRDAKYGFELTLDGGGHSHTFWVGAWRFRSYWQNGNTPLIFTTSERDAHQHIISVDRTNTNGVITYNLLLCRFDGQPDTSDTATTCLDGHKAVLRF